MEVGILGDNNRGEFQGDWSLERGVKGEGTKKGVFEGAIFAPHGEEDVNTCRDPN
jgi:hypothetical protein